MERINELISEIENAINKHETSKLSVSSSSVGWHVEHALLTINAIIDDIKKSKPENYKRALSFNRLLVFAMNKIPRGRAKAPAGVTPQKYDQETLKAHLEKTKMQLRELPLLNPDKYFTHPMFGHLKLKPTIKFVEIHTKHHVHIIRDILS